MKLLPPLMSIFLEIRIIKHIECDDKQNKFGNIGAQISVIDVLHHKLDGVMLSMTPHPFYQFF
jgi:hypothetical protein